MATTLLFYSLKSNVGKTTISVIAADHLSRLNKRVLLVDLDAQASATRIMEKSYREIPIKIALSPPFIQKFLRCYLDIVYYITPWSGCHLDNKKYFKQKYS